MPHGTPPELGSASRSKLENPRRDGGGFPAARALLDLLRVIDPRSALSVGSGSARIHLAGWWYLEQG